jgi:purine-nucleoside phosphorylase
VVTGPTRSLIDLDAAAARVRERIPSVPRTMVVLGSGAGHLVDALQGPVEVPFTDIPGFPAAGAPGHAGRFVVGSWGDAPVLVQAGRYHVYEGHDEDVVAAPVRTAARLGVETLVLTNAAGGLDPSLEPGDLVLLEDHLNFMFRGPLRGPVRRDEARFPDMSHPWDPELRTRALEVGWRRGIALRQGVYAGVTGPSYETAAEVRMLRRLGGDVVAMSVIPEILAARPLGLRCLGLSLVTNKGTGYGREPLSHDDVVAAGREAESRLGSFLQALVAELASASSTGAK